MKILRLILDESYEAALRQHCDTFWCQYIGLSSEQALDAFDAGLRELAEARADVESHLVSQE